MNETGRVVFLLLAFGLAFTGVAILRGHFDGAALVAVVSLTFAVLITVGSGINRKRRHHS